MSLVEVVVSTMLVGVVLVGALNCLGAVVRGRGQTDSAGRGALLAEQLMTEILNSEFVDGGASPVFGPESGEAIGNRSAFDDVDDFHLWTASPPQDRSGTPVLNTNSWQRDVLVENVDPLSPGSISASDLGVKRVTITVQRNSQVVTKLVGLRSDQYLVP